MAFLIRGAVIFILAFSQKMSLADDRLLVSCDSLYKDYKVSALSNVLVKDLLYESAPEIGPVVMHEFNADIIIPDYVYDKVELVPGKIPVIKKYSSNASVMVGVFVMENWITKQMESRMSRHYFEAFEKKMFLIALL